MKLRKVMSLVVTIAVVMTLAAVISVPAASAATVNTDTAFSEDFESYGVLDQQNTLLTLKNSGWYACDHTRLYTNVSTVAPYSTMSYKLANLETVDGSTVLRIITAGGTAGKTQAKYGYGRAFPGVAANGAATGTYEVQFDYKPILDSTNHYTQFYFGFNTADGTAANETDAQHSILAGYNQSFYIGNRNYNTLYNDGSPIPQGTLPAANIGSVTWYTVKAYINCDAHYYSAEIYNRATGKLIARRSPISFAADENIGFLKFSALGIGYIASVYIDNVSIEKKASRENLIFEDTFDYSNVALAGSGVTVPSASEDLAGASYFEGYTPWRARTASGRDYGLDIDPTLNSKVVRLGDDPLTTGTEEKSGLVYMPVKETILEKETQEERGKVKLSFKIKPDTVGGTQFRVYAIPEYNSSLDLMSSSFTLTGNSGAPVLVVPGGNVDLDSSKWYEVETVLDVVNEETHTAVTEFGASAPVASYSNNFEGKLTALKGIMFNAIGGTTVHMDDIKLEYYEADPAFDAGAIVLTDQFDNEVTGTANVTTAVRSIRIPFGCDMKETDAITLTDRANNAVTFTLSRLDNSYELILDDLLKQGETYTVTIPSTVENVFGVQLGGADRTFTFTTTDSLADLMNINAVKIGDTKVGALSDITAGSTLNVEVNYANSTAEAIEGDVFVAFYNGKRLVRVLMGSKTVSAGEYGTDVSTFSFAVPSDLDLTVDKVSVFLWNGLSNITPYCRAKSFQ